MVAMAALDSFTLTKSRKYVSDSVLPMGILFIVAMMVLPLPTILLDLFFTTLTKSLSKNEFLSLKFKYICLNLGL